MTKYYPIMLNLEGKNCLVIGGGTVASRKVEELLDYGAVVTVISKVINEKIKDFKEKGRIHHIEDYYLECYLAEAYLVIASTNDREVNEGIFKDCNTKGIPVNIVDDPQNCSFIVPSRIKRGDLTIAVSTNGKSPLLSRIIRQELEMVYDENFSTFVDILTKVRLQVRENVKILEKRMEIYEAIAAGNYLHKFRTEGEKAVREELGNLLKTHLYGRL